MIAYYHGEVVEEIVVAEQGTLAEGEEALPELLVEQLRRELSRAA
jgi:hypothetical protein